MLEHNVEIQRGFCKQRLSLENENNGMKTEDPEKSANIVLKSFFQKAFI